MDLSPELLPMDLVQRCREPDRGGRPVAEDMSAHASNAGEAERSVIIGIDEATGVRSDN